MRHRSTGESLLLPGLRFLRSSALPCALTQTYFPLGLELRLISRLTVDLLTPIS